MPFIRRQRLKRLLFCRTTSAAGIQTSLFAVAIVVISLVSRHRYSAEAFTSPKISKNLGISTSTLIRRYEIRLLAKGDDDGQGNQYDKPKNAKKNKNKNNPQQSKKKGKPKPKPQNKAGPKNSDSILSLLTNPFQAGKKLRKSLDSALTTFGPGLSPEQRSIYYLDDRFLESSATNPSEGALAFAERNPLFDQVDSSSDDYIPEVLVVGASGAIGRLVVRRMVLSNRFRVRVLVRNLYSETLNLLGTGVTYCQGDLGNIESLEYAVTDVDKIVFCAGPPRKDEDDFGNKFRDFAKETLIGDGNENLEGGDGDVVDLDFQTLSDTMEIRAKLAQQVDDLGMQNIVRAYQNVRYADYGTSQAAKRSLFKFQDREEDFNLFTINVDDEDDDDIESKPASSSISSVVPPSADDAYKAPDYNFDEYDYGDYEYNEDAYNEGAYDETDSYMEMKPESKTRSATTIQSQVNWMKNKFNHGVFVGKLPVALKGSAGSEASIISSRLRSRDDPEMGTDLSNGFAGFVCRVCADGKSYQCFIRTSEYESNGIEYIYTFDTETKTSSDRNKSLNKFQTIRIPFSKLKPVVRRRVAGANQDALGKPFRGKDVKQIGFRVNSAENILSDSDPNKKKYKWVNFYIALCYIKVYRSQPEPEFIYLSDARIPPRVKEGLVRHDLKRIITSDEKEDGGSLFDEKEAKRVLQNPKDRSGEELYYKYKGEEILKNSGLQYSIIRVPSLNELPSGEFSTVQLKQTNDQLTSVSRAEVAECVVSALFNPSARNVCFYLSKAKPGSKVGIDTKISSQFGNLDPEI